MIWRLMEGGGIINLDVVVLLLMYGFVLEEKYARN